LCYFSLDSPPVSPRVGKICARATCLGDPLMGIADDLPPPRELLLGIKGPPKFGDPPGKFWPKVRSPKG